jgi:ABC-type nitrate/sulfonate/bicarbonate transport system ATPase subunit
MSAVEQTLAKSDPVVARLRGVTKQYKRGNEVVPVLESWTWTAARAFRRALGPSGSGKTTLLNLLGGPTVRPRAAWKSTDSHHRMSDSALAAWRGSRRPVGQMYNLLPLTAGLCRTAAADAARSHAAAHVHTALSLSDSPTA